MIYIDIPYQNLGEWLVNHSLFFLGMWLEEKSSEDGSWINRGEEGLGMESCSLAAVEADHSDELWVARHAIVPVDGGRKILW